MNISLKPPSNIDDIQVPLDHITILVSFPEMLNSSNLVFNLLSFVSIYK